MFPIPIHSYDKNRQIIKIKPPTPFRILSMLSQQLQTSMLKYVKA